MFAPDISIIGDPDNAKEVVAKDDVVAEPAVVAVVAVPLKDVAVITPVTFNPYGNRGDPDPAEFFN